VEGVVKLGVHTGIGFRISARLVVVEFFYDTVVVDDSNAYCGRIRLGGFQTYFSRLTHAFSITNRGMGFRVGGKVSLQSCEQLASVAVGGINYQNEMNHQKLIRI